MSNVLNADTLLATQRPSYTEQFRPRKLLFRDRFFSIFTARCYASAIQAMGLCLSVCLSVTSRSSIETAERIEVGFGM